jgi:hypothetical protein
MPISQWSAAARVSLRMLRSQRHNTRANNACGHVHRADMLVASRVGRGGLEEWTVTGTVRRVARIIALAFAACFVANNQRQSDFSLRKLQSAAANQSQLARAHLH